MKRFIVSAALLIAAIGFTVAPATAAAPEGNKIQCFSGTQDTADNAGYGPYGGTCTQLSPNRAFLDTSPCTEPNGCYAGVYLPNQEINGKLIGDVEKLSFNYNGFGASGGSPRLSIPIDTDGDGDTEFFAFVDVLGCNDGSTTRGKLDVINDPTCTIQAGSETFPNYAAFVAAHPTYKIAMDNYAFVVQDQPGEFTIWNVQIGNKSRGGK